MVAPNPELYPLEEGRFVKSSTLTALPDYVIVEPASSRVLLTHFTAGITNGRTGTSSIDPERNTPRRSPAGRILPLGLLGFLFEIALRSIDH